MKDRIEPTKVEVKECDNACFAAARKTLEDYEQGDDKGPKKIVLALSAAFTEREKRRMEFKKANGDNSAAYMLGEDIPVIVASAFVSSCLELRGSIPPRSMIGASVCEFVEAMFLMRAAQELYNNTDFYSMVEEESAALAAAAIAYRDKQ